MNTDFPYIQVPTCYYPNLNALRELFRDRGVFPHVKDGVVTFSPPTERELRDDEYRRGYDQWRKIEGNEFKSHIEYLHEKLQSEGKIQTISAWDLMSEEDKEFLSKPLYRGNLLVSRYD